MNSLRHLRKLLASRKAALVLSGWDFSRFARFDFLILCTILLMFNAPLLDRSIWWKSDTIFIFEMFYAFYNHFFYHQEIMRWMPYGSFGIQAEHSQLSNLSPASYLVMFFGALFRLRDVLVAFKLSVLIEQLMLLAGTYLLAGKLFKFKLTRFFLCFCAIAGSIWVFQLFWNLRLNYLLPLMMYLLLVFARDEKPQALWLAGIVFMLAQLGVPFYFSAINFFLLLVFFFVSAKNISSLKCMFKNEWSNWISLFCFLVVFFVELYVVSHMYDHIASMIPGRDPVTRTTSLDSFLGFEGAQAMSSSLGFSRFLGLLTPTALDFDSLLYPGVVGLAFSLFALLRVRGRLFYGLVGMVFFMACLVVTYRLPVAKIFYFLYPPIRYFRYLEATDSIIRLLLLLVASFGFDRFLGEISSDNNTRAKRLLGFCFIALALLCVGFLWVNSVHGLYQVRWPQLLYVGLALLSGATLLLFFSRLRSRVLAMVVGAFVILDLTLFNFLFYSSWGVRLTGAPPSVTSVYPHHYQEQRSMRLDAHPRAQAAINVAQSAGPMYSSEVANFILVDVAVPREWPNHNWSESFAELVTVRFPTFFTEPSFLSFLGKYGNELFKLIGAEELGENMAKMRLVSYTAVAKDRAQARQMVPLVPDLSEAFVLEHVPKWLEDAWHPFVAEEPLGTVRVNQFNFNELSLTARVLSKFGAWLFYADAYHPGWKAFVNGNSVSVSRANLAFKAVYLPPGEHAVRLVYWDGFQSLGTNLIGLFGLIFSLTMLVISFKLMRG